MKRFALVAMTLIFVLSFAGCGDSSSDSGAGGGGGAPLSAAQSKQVVPAVMTAVQSAFAQVQTAGATPTAKLVADGLTVNADGSISGDITNPAPGSGTVSIVASKSGDLDYTMTMTFDAWTSSGITLDGQVTTTVSMDTTGGMAMTMKGDIDVTGSVSGSVSMDVSVTVAGGAPTVTGTVNGESFSYP